MSSLDDTLKCAHCQSLLNKPVILPCGHSICQEHQHHESSSNTSANSKEEAKNNDRSIECKPCTVLYRIPVDGFTRNITVERMLENRLDLAVEQNVAFKACLELKFQMRKLRRLQSLSNTVVGRILGELKTKVNKKRDELKQKIDSDANKLVNELDQLETECNNKPQNPLRSEATAKALKTSDESLIKWENEELLAEKVDAWKAVANNANMFTSNLKNEIMNFEYEIFCGKFPDLKQKQIDFCKLNIEAPKTIKIKCDAKIKNSKPIFSECKSEYGIDWNLIVSIEKNFQTDDKTEMIVVYLCPKKNNDKFNLNVQFDLEILNKLSPSKNVVKKLSHFYEDKGMGYHIIELSKVFSNPEFYNSEEDIFTVQATILEVKWIKIEKVN